MMREMPEGTDIAEPEEFEAPEPQLSVDQLEDEEVLPPLNEADLPLAEGEA